MIAFMIVTFVALLVISTPVAIVLLTVTGLTLQFFLHIPLQALVQQLFNGMDNFVLLSIPFFILAGNLMGMGSISKYLVEVMQLVTCRIHGGMAVAATLACMFFAAISGSSPATVVAIGSIMIPALIAKGYGERFSIGLLTSAGSLGILIPPSIPMVVYCLVMNASVGELFLAGIVPGIVIGIILIGYSIVMSKKNKWDLACALNWQGAPQLLKRASWGIAMPVIVLGGIYSGIFTPTEAAAVSVVYALFVEFFIYKSLTLEKFHRILIESVIMSAALLFIIGCAMTFIWLLTREKLPVLAASFIIEHIQNKYVFLLAINVFLLLVGCVMDIVSSVLVISPILLAALQQYNIDIIHYGIIMIVNIEMGFLTFPFGLNLFVAMGITGKSLTEVGRSVLPFLALFLLALLLITYVPAISTLLPTLVMR